MLIQQEESKNDFKVNLVNYIAIIVESTMTKFIIVNNNNRHDCDFGSKSTLWIDLVYSYCCTSSSFNNCFILI